MVRLLARRHGHFTDVLLRVERICIVCLLRHTGMSTVTIHGTVECNSHYA